jgi:hypothetical protein
MKMPRSKRMRPRRGGEPLSVDLLVSTAIAMIDRDGFDGFSMRKLGQELGVDPRACYRHVPSQDALFDAVVEKVLAEVARNATPTKPRANQRMKNQASGSIRLAASTSMVPSRKSLPSSIASVLLSPPAKSLGMRTRTASRPRRNRRRTARSSTL